ncbi:hypothetical protein PybrP1_000549 [[Pythium] brassicae (nom. inval.)]|nr:hypothetical protein PybrP1_000549 [[Pythium] brassicae (nom. inval.)]
MAELFEQVIVVTGASSGVGLECCRALVAAPRTLVVAVGRAGARLEAAEALLAREAHVTSRVQARAADLSSLASVRTLANALLAQRLRVFALVCNAGVESPPESTSADGFETTFATNHLGHFLLATALATAGAFAADSGARLVVVSSSLHSTDNSAGAASQPDVSDWDRVAFGHDDAGWTPKRAYATSKLCNVLFGYEFERRHGDAARVYLYTPGFVPDTGLFRNHSALGWLVVKTLLKLVAYWRPSAFLALSTPARSGAFLARLASDRELPWDSGSYFSVDHLFHSSEQSKDPVLARELWERSMQWVDK